MKSLDKRIKNLVQSLEKEIPGEIENNCHRELQRTTILTVTHSKKMWQVLRLTAATAAGIALLLLLLPTTKEDTGRSPEFIYDSVLLQSAELEGKPVETYVFREQNPEMTIIWMEQK